MWASFQDQFGSISERVAEGKAVTAVQSEEDGLIVKNVSNQILAATPYSPLRQAAHSARHGSVGGTAYQFALIAPSFNIVGAGFKRLHTAGTKPLERLFEQISSVLAERLSGVVPEKLAPFAGDVVCIDESTLAPCREPSEKDP